MENNKAVESGQSQVPAQANEGASSLPASTPQRATANDWRFVIHESRNYGLTPSIATPGKAIGFCFIPGIGYVATGVNLLILYPIFISRAVSLCTDQLLMIGKRQAGVRLRAIHF